MRTVTGVTALAIVAVFAAACSGGAASPAARPPPRGAVRVRRGLRGPVPGRRRVRVRGAQARRPPAPSPSAPTTPPTRRTTSRPTRTTDPWELGDPTNRLGFEGRAAWTIARNLGFVGDTVTWVAAPFNNAIGPGAKDFDIYLSQVSFSDERAQAVDLSDGYYDVAQAVVAREGQQALEGDDDLRPQGLPVRRAGRHDQPRRRSTRSSPRPRRRRSTTPTTSRSRRSRTARSTASSSTCRRPCYITAVQFTAA